MEYTVAVRRDAVELHQNKVNKSINWYPRWFCACRLGFEFIVMVGDGSDTRMSNNNNKQNNDEEKNKNK